jgi:hypothetical protein
MINFAEAVGIVLVVLAVFMGWRMGLIIGMALIATVLASFMLMKIFGIDLQRMSLGALVIALGMMVDNAIVVADGYVVRLGKGMAPKDAAIEAARLPAWPLLGATVVAVMAFYPVYASVEDAGEYCRTLFSVVAISLLVSWLISMTLTPMQCIDLIKPKTGDEGAAKDPYDSRFYRVYRGFLETAIRLRFLTVGCMIGLLFLALYGFGSVSQQFFPDSSMTKFMIDYWGPEGTRIQQVDRRRAGIGSRCLYRPGTAALLSASRPGEPLPVLWAAHRQRARLPGHRRPCRRIHGLVQRKLPAVLGRDPKIRRRAQQYLEVRAANQRAGGRRPGGFARTCRRGPADFGRRAAQRLFPHRLAYTGAEDRPAVQSGTRPLGRGFARRSGQCHQARIRWAYDWPLP